jgi:dTDP-4-dehydrorhamnose 3,5-epimerase
MVKEVIPFEKACKIDGLKLTPLRKIMDNRGSVMHFLKSDSPNFIKFGESYFSTINKNKIKGWKCHKIINQNFCVPMGSVKFVIFDNRSRSKTYGQIDEIILDSKKNYYLLSLPAGLWYSFKCINSTVSLIANIINEQHVSEGADLLPIKTKSIPYEWE